MNAKRTAFLKWLDGLEPQTFSLDPSEETVIGREPTCHLVLNSAKYGGVSRRHAVIRYRSESLSFEISDLGSSNGTYVNRQRLSSGHLLKSGDRIQLGSHGVEFNFEDPSLPATVVQPGANQPPVTIPDAENSDNQPFPSSSSPHSPSSPSPSSSAAPATSRSRNRTLIRAVLVGSGLLVTLLILSRGRIQQIWEQRQSSPDRSSATTTTQTYAAPDGQFQVDLPVNYAIETRANGINLASPDGSFQGAITVIEVPRQITATEIIQEFTRQQSTNPNLEDFTMQNSTEVEGGVRIDWVARLDSANADLDAVTYFIQRENLVVEVDLFSVDRSFTQQDATEANLILRSLRVGQ